MFLFQAERESDGGEQSNQGNNSSNMMEDTTRSCYCTKRYKKGIALGIWSLN